MKNSIEQELNKIRVSLYEETKKMSPSELTAYIKEQTEPMLSKYGIKPVSGIPAKTSDSKRAAI
jgi:hypothetical protein